MKRMKRRRFAGAVCEQIVFCVADGTRNIPQAMPRIRFKDGAERAEHTRLISRRRHAARFNENFSPRSLYSTLTFDDDWEVHAFSDAKRIRDNYYRTLRKAFPDAVIFLYMGRGKGTHRIHFHMVTEGIPEEVIKEKWKYGRILRVGKLRKHNYYNGIDHGQDYTGLANYLFDHWTEEQGGHRWKMSKNARKPEEEQAKEVKRNYTEEKPPRAPRDYILVESKSTRYGYLYFKYVKKPEQEPRRKNRRKPDSKAL